MAKRRLLSDDEVFGTAELLSDEDVFGDPARQALPADVKPSAVQGGRGTVVPPARPPVLQTAEPEPITGTPEETQTQLTEMPRLSALDRAPAPGTITPEWAAERRADDAALAERAARAAPGTIGPSPDPSALAGVLQTVTPKTEQRGAAAALRSFAADAARGTVKAPESIAKAGWDALSLGADVAGLDTFGEIARAASRSGQASLAQLDNPNGDKLVTGAFQSLGVALLGGAAGGTAGAIAAGTGQSGLDEYQRARAAGAPIDEALTAGTVYGIAEYLGERIQIPSLVRMLRQFADRGMAPRQALIEALKQQGGEQVTTAMQALQDKFGTAGSNPGMTAEEYLGNVIETAKQVAIMSAVTGGAGIAAGAARGGQPAAAAPLPTAEQLARDRGFLTGAQPPAAAAPAPAAPVTLEQMPTTPISTAQAQEIAQRRAVARAQAAPEGEVGVLTPAAQAAAPTAAPGAATVGVATVPQGAIAERAARVAIEQEPPNVQPVATPAAAGLPAQGLAVDAGAAPADAARSVPRADDAGAGVPVRDSGGARLAARPGEQAAADREARVADEALSGPVKLDVEPFRSRGAAMAWAVENQLGKGAEPVDTGHGWTFTPRKVVRTVQDIQERVDAVEKLALAIDASGTRRGAERPIEAVSDAEVAGTPAGLVARVAESAFGIDVIAIRGLGERGVSYKGRAYFDVDQVAAEDPRAASILAVGIIGHESKHALDRVAPELARKLDAVIDRHTRFGAIARRIEAENKGRGDGQPTVSMDIGMQEVRADVVGGLWLDPEFWRRVYQLDDGSLARRILYQFMRAATKFVAVAKGTQFDVQSILGNVEKVREAAAQAFAEAARTRGSRAAAAQPDTESAPAYSRSGFPVIDEGKFERERRRQTERDEAPEPPPRAVREGLGVGRPTRDPADELGAFDIDRKMAEDDGSIDWVPEKPKRASIEGYEPPAEDKGDKKPELTDDEIDAINRELAAATAGTVDTGLPSAEEIAKAGVMAEEAFRPLMPEAFAERGGKWTLDGWWVRMASDEHGRAYEVTTSELALYGDDLSFDGAVAHANRMMAAGHLFKQSFDMLDTVPARKHKAVAVAARKLASVPGAFAQPYAAAAPKAGSLTLLWNNIEREKPAIKAAMHNAMDAIDAREKYKATFSQDRGGGRSAVTIALTDPRSGEQVTGYLQGMPPDPLGVNERHLVAHTMGLGEAKGTGIGAVWYQIAARFARNVGMRIAPDTILTTVNQYRRTENMVSAALRTPEAGAMVPGMGQRIYGWNLQASRKGEHDANIVRLMLASLRNVRELAPGITNVRYDLAKGKFFKRSDGSDGEMNVKLMLADRDARAMGLGRKAMARAALMQDVLAGNAKVLDVDRAAEPILYSRTGIDQVLADEAQSNDVQGAGRQRRAGGDAEAGAVRAPAQFRPRVLRWWFGDDGGAVDAAVPVDAESPVADAGGLGAGREGLRAAPGPREEGRGAGPALGQGAGEQGPGNGRGAGQGQDAGDAGLDAAGLRDAAAPEQAGQARLTEPAAALSAAGTDPFADNYAALAGRPVSYQVRIEDTGQTATVTVDAAAALRELDSRRETMRKIIDCLKRS